MWDTPELVQAERNKALYSEVRVVKMSLSHDDVEVVLNVPNGIFICWPQRLYKASFEKNRGNFKYTSDTPFFQAAKQASVLINDVSPFFFLTN